MKQKGTKLTNMGKERDFFLAKKVLQMVRKLKAEAWLDYISFSYDIYTYIISNSPKAKVAYLNGDVAPEKLKADGFFGSDYHFSVFKNNKWIETSKILDLTKKDYPIRTIGATMLAVRDGK